MLPLLVGHMNLGWPILMYCTFLRITHSATCNSVDAIDSQASPSVSCANRDPPAFDLAELGVRHIDEQRQTGHPHTHLELRTQETVGEVQHHPALPSRLLPVDEHVVTSLRHLEEKKRAKWVRDRQTQRGSVSLRLGQSVTNYSNSFKRARLNAILLKSIMDVVGEILSLGLL